MSLDDDRGEAPAEPRVTPIGARWRLGIVFLMYLYRAGAALVLAAPIADLALLTVGGYPRGDAELFDPGAVMLLEAGRLARPATRAMTTHASLVGIAACFIGLLPLAALLHALGQEGKLRWGAMGAAALRHLGTFSMLLGFALVAQAGAAALVVLLGGSLLGQLDLSPRYDDYAMIGIAVLAVTLVLVVGVIHDLGRVYAVHHDHGFYSATAGALRALRRFRWRLLFAYLWRGLLAIAFLGGSVVVAYRAGWGTTEQIAISIGAHQVAVFAAVVLRASWLAAAMRFADRERAAAEDLREGRKSESSWKPPAPKESEPPPKPVGESLIRVRAIEPEAAPKEPELVKPPAPSIEPIIEEAAPPSPRPAEISLSDVEVEPAPPAAPVSSKPKPPRPPPPKPRSGT